MTMNPEPQQVQIEGVLAGLRQRIADDAVNQAILQARLAEALQANAELQRQLDELIEAAARGVAEAHFDHAFANGDDPDQG